MEVIKLQVPDISRHLLTCWISLDLSVSPRLTKTNLPVSKNYRGNRLTEPTRLISIWRWLCRNVNLMKSLATISDLIFTCLGWLIKIIKLNICRYFVSLQNDQPGNVGGLNRCFDFQSENSTSTEMDCGRLWVVIFYYQN